jgi:hypothetical protein
MIPFYYYGETSIDETDGEKSKRGYCCFFDMNIRTDFFKFKIFLSKLSKFEKGIHQTSYNSL